MTYIEHTRDFTWRVHKLTAKYTTYDIDDCDVEDIVFSDDSSIWGQLTDRLCEEVHDFFISMMTEDGKVEEMERLLSNREEL